MEAVQLACHRYCFSSLVRGSAALELVLAQQERKQALVTWPILVESVSP